MYEFEVIESVINFHNVKYTTLTDLIRNSSMEGDHINVFINVDSILNLFYSDNMIPAVLSLRSYENIILTAELINMVAHYRHFYWSRFKVPSKFYFYYCNEKPKRSIKLNKDYMNSTFFKKNTEHPMYGEVNNILNSNLRLCELLSKYVQGCYFLSSDNLEPSVLPYYLIKNNKEKNICNILITSDKMDYQLCNLDNTFILRTKGSNSKIISKDDIYNHKIKNIKYRPSNTIEPEFYTILLSLIGEKSRNVTRVEGYTLVKSLKLIDTLIKEEDLDKTNYKAIIMDSIKEYLDEKQYEQFITNYKCLSLEYQYNLLKEVDALKIQNKLVDKYDNMSIMNINSEYFPNNNIRLVELCEGVENW